MRCHRIARSALGALLLGALHPAAAVTVNRIALTDSAGRYTVAFDVSMHAEPRTVRRIITDYNRLSRLSHLVKQSRIVAVLPDGRQQISITLRGCVLFFCKSVHRVEDVADEPDGDIVTKALPRESDFSYAVERWRILPQAGGTRLEYQATLVPSFFIPPLIGPYIVKSEIRRELMQTARQVEILADRHAPGATPKP